MSVRHVRRFPASRLAGCVLGPWLAAGTLLACGGEPAEIATTLLDEGVVHYATFQSHNQKVVARGSRIFTTHLRDRNAAYTAQTWRLSLSDDGGATFRTLLEETAATNPPVIEIDAAGTLYLVRVDFESGDAWVDRWPGDRPPDAAGRRTTRIPGAAAGKYAALLDEPRGLLHVCSHNGTFHRVRTDGTLVDSRTILRGGDHAILQYPHLSLDEAGRIHLAWTTQKHGAYLYWDIHHMLSDDGGETFRSLAGPPLPLPVVADDTGPTTRLTLDDEFDVHTWLASGLARAGRWHGFYEAQFEPRRQHLVCLDIATGRREHDRHPTVGGDTIRLRGLDGFLVADRHEESRLYVVGNHDGHLACLVSDDRGSTWRDHARTAATWALYSIGGSRWTTDDGDVIGTFTDQVPPAHETDGRSRVYFFRIPGAARSGPLYSPPSR